ncbi:OmpH family outer membrane protein [Ornithobacterium rhinotracheale]|uniref:OmpH family outer membrane protein n=1 Tax=Ornithobacterium rhinotracheale TaxID=28251 RepID=UPI00129C742B|nr:OmpH family outer membrane protein [Ornithobacterium rhinotracheale]MRI62573.1 OmpH family outer membrane protein [Ornithobacterium rhinotracheale]MRJ07659.1 OmpH family outer membrane protein [Ornithobacterium rhinotracheale]MRJ10294.1 OmpH family outer membrane protein [Ornithobacterium rhinotracheale]UOH78255.1 OmpH family outer membrane protein [Ornithobacterium rhinotracheale]
MKKFTFIALLSFLCLGFGFANAQSVAHVNSQEILEALPAFNDAQTKIKKEAERHQAEVQRQQKEIQALYEKAQKQMEALKNKSDAEKMKALAPLEQELQTKSKALQEYQQKAAKDVAKMENDLLAPVYKKVQAAIEEVGKKGNVGYIIDLATAGQSGTIVYFGGGKDLTPQVKKQLGL